MKNTLYSITLLTTTLFLFSCGGKSESSTTSNESAATENTTAVETIPTLTINEADWEVKDLGSISKMVPISVKVPKNAKLEQNGNGGVDISVNDFYLITVSSIYAGSIKEALDGDKSLTINSKSYQNGKAITEEPNGMIYTMQMKDEANGKKYQPEAHFVYYLQKGPDEAIYSIKDERPLSNFSVSGSAYSEEIAKKIYELVKASAKVN